MRGENVAIVSVSFKTIKYENAEHVPCYGGTEHRVTCKALSEQAFSVRERRKGSVHNVHMLQAGEGKKNEN